MLNKEFIPYELAIALKELGFDEPCLMAYIGKDNQLYSKCDDVLHLNTIDDVLNPLKAPTFSQAFRWFREKYGWVAEIHGSLQMNRFYANLLLQAKGQVNNIKMCDTYEEAENACINKLIEIVKQK